MAKSLRMPRENEVRVLASQGGTYTYRYNRELVGMTFADAVKALGDNDSPHRLPSPTIQGVRAPYYLNGKQVTADDQTILTTTDVVKVNFR